MAADGHKPQRVLSFSVEPELENGLGEHSGLEAAPLLLDSEPSGPVTRPASLRRLASKFTLASEKDAGSWAAYKHEAGRLVRLGVPLSASHFFGFAQSLISVACIGRLGQFELSAAVLATSFFNVTGMSVLMGFVGAQETLGGQAFGAARYRAVGDVLQRAILLTLLLGALICALWTQMARAMLWMGQDSAIVAGAARYLQLSMPALLASGVFECLKRYLMAQNVVKPSTVVACVATALSPLYNWLLIFRLRLGLDGAVAALVAAQLTMLGGLAAWTLHHDRRLAGTRQQTWHGWSWEAVRGWGLYLRLALPSTAMLCMEWWTYEICILMSGWLANPSLNVAVMGLCMNTTGALYMASLGLSSATTVRVSNALGAGLPHAAQRTTRTAAAMAIGIQLSLAASIACSSSWLGYLFTDVEEVVLTAAGVYPILALSLPGDGLNAVLGGVLRGAGRQAFGAALNVVTYWCLGLPLAGLLAFKANLGVKGLWAGLATTTSLQGCAVSVVVARLNWEREAERAAENVGHSGGPATKEAAVVPGGRTALAGDSAVELIVAPVLERAASELAEISLEDSARFAAAPGTPQEEEQLLQLQPARPKQDGGG